MDSNELIKRLLETDSEPSQDERIKQNLADFYESPEDYSFYDLEEIFEDRDPVEFL